MVFTANVVRTTFTGIDTSGITSGILGVSRGGTGVANSTGTGNVVLSNAPVLSNVTMSVSSGSVAAPSLTFVGNSSTGLYMPSANAVSISTAGVERLRIDGSGNVGIGATSPQYALDLGGFAATTQTLRIGTASSGNSQIKLSEHYSDDTFGFTLRNVASSKFAILRHSGSVTGTESLSITRDTGVLTATGFGGGTMLFRSTDANSTDFNIKTPDQNGALQVFMYNNHSGTFFDAARIAGGYAFRHAGNDAMYLTSSTTMIGFQGMTLPAGNAQKPGGGSWASYSDRRLKTNITTANTQQCYDIVKLLPLQRFDFIPEYVANTAVLDTRVVGWIADDVETIFPKAVTTTKAFGMDDVKTLDVDQLYKTMWGCVTKLIEDKEVLESRIQDLETRLEALEPKN